MRQVLCILPHDAADLPRNLQYSALVTDHSYHCIIIHQRPDIDSLTKSDNDA